MLEPSVFPRLQSSFHLPYFSRNSYWIKSIVTPGICLAAALTCAFVVVPSQAQGAAHLTSTETVSGGASTVSARGDFSSIAVGSKSAAQTFTFTFDKGATIGVPQVLTEGMSDMDFADTTSGSCDTNGTSHVYQPGDTCTLTVLFTPKYAGARKGAVKLVDSSNHVLAIAYIHGVGAGGVKPSAMGAQDVLAHTDPQGVALDGAGNLYVADIVTGAVHLYGTRGGHYWQIQDVAAAGSLQQPYGVAVDGGGNVYVSDATLNVVRKYVPIGASYAQVNDVASGLYQPQGIAVDGSGNVYVAEAGNRDVRKYAPNSDGSYARAQDVTSSGLQQPNGVAIDSKGNIYVSDAGVGAVLRYAPNSDGSYAQLANVADSNTLHQPYGVAVDAHGDVFIADAPNNLVHEYAPSITGGYNKLSDVGQGLNSPHSVALDGNGNVYIANTGSSQVVKDRFASLGRLTPEIAFNWNLCVSPSPVTFSSPTDQPTLIEIGGGANTDGDGNTCDLGVLGLFPTTNNEDLVFQDFNTTTLHNVGITFHFSACNFVTSGGAGSGGCLPNGAASLNTYYTLQLDPTTETSDSVTVYMDPNQTGTPNEAVVIPLTINSAASTTTTVTSSINPATSGQSETFTATVTSSSTVNQGTVSFSSDGVTISGCSVVAVSNGVATCTVAFAAGSHSIVATYSGASSFALSTSATLTQTVNPAVTATQAIASKALTQNNATGSFTPIIGGGGTLPLSYSISPSLPTGLNLSPVTGAIIGNPSVTSSATTYTVTVTDANSRQATNTFSLTVNSVVTATPSVPVKILTQNHSAPSFTPVTGGGGTAPLTYSISPTLTTGLTLNSSTGAITGAPANNIGLVSYTVTVTDANGATASNGFELAVNSELLAFQAVGSKALTLNRTASFTPVLPGGGTNPYVYSISPTLPAGLSFSTTTGMVSGTPSVTLASTTFTVAITDANGATASNTFLLVVNAAVTATQSIATEILTQSRAASFTPVTRGGGTNPLTYSITPTLPTGLSISSSTGAISGTPSVTSSATTYTVTITDQNGSTASNTFALVINSAVTATQSISSAALTQNHATTSFTPVTGGSGTGTLTYSISPTLPTGLSISSSTGTISGNASATLTATTFTVTVTDQNSATATNTFSLTVNPAVTATQSIVSKALTQNHAAISFTPVTGGGGTTPLAFSISPTLPTGLSMSPTTGAITGNPSVTSSATTYTVTVTDANSATATNTFNLTVNPAVTATQSIASKALTQNLAAANFTPVTGGGGTTPLAFSISPTLPTGLSMSPTTGAITGNPSVTSSATTYTVTVTDANSETAANTFSLTVNSAVTATQSIPSIVLTQSHAATSFTPVTGGGGTGTLMYSISPTLPTGLSISSSTGAITGNPSATSSAITYTVTVTDVNSATATNTFSLTVNSVVTATQSIASTILTQSHGVTSFTPVTGGGGTTPRAYSISPTLPTGLSMSPTTGAITGNPSGTSSATTYTVTVTDANSETAANTFSLTVNSAVTATQSIASIILTQSHAATSFTPVTGGGGTGTLMYSISPTLPTGLSISSSTGAITGNPSATLAATTFTVTVTDANSATVTATFSLTVNSAVTATQSIVLKVLTQNQVAASFTPVTGGGGTGTLAYAISPTLPTGLTISPSTGAITGTATGTSSATTYTVTVTDSNNASASNTFSLTVNAPPTATQSIATKTLTQNHAATSFIPVAGSGGTPSLSYSISPVLPAGLSISSTTGAITGTPTATSTATTYTVTVTDANSATATATFSLTVSSAVTATQAIASTVLTQNHAATSFTPVTGANGTGTLTYSVSPSLPVGLSLSSSTGAVTGTPTATSTATTYTVTVTDANSATATATFSLAVNATVTATLAISQAFLTKSFAVTPFTPVQGGGGTAPLSYSISPTLPSGLSIGSSSGAVSGTPSVTSTATTYTVTVTDANGETAAQSFAITVNGPVSTTTAIASIGETVDHPITSVTPVIGSGGTGTLHYTVSPTLPPGIAMNPTTGAISGLPTSPTSAATYTVTVTDANNATATATFNLAINGQVTASTAIASKVLTQNQASASFTPVTGGGGTIPLTYSVSPALPAGLSINSTSAVVSGSPTGTSAATSYTVTVTDANGSTASASFSLTVSPAVSATQVVASAVLTQNHAAASFTPVTGSGGTGTLAYSILPSLPAGLNFSSTSGAITGTPSGTSTATSYTVTATDTNGATATNSFSLTVKSAVSATQSIASALLTQSHAATSFIPVTGGGGTGTLTYSISPTLPAGLNFSSSTGAITGTPSATLVATTFTVTVTDQNSATASNTFSLTISSAVAAAQSVPSVVLTQNHAATSFNPVTGSGGTGTLGYSVSPVLPTGLNFSSSTGTITGTPTVALAATTFTITVTDQNSATASNTFSLTINAVVTATQSIATAVLTQNHATTSFTPVTGGGGTGTLSYSVSPVLPTGLNFNSITGTISGTPTVGSSATSYTVTVTDANGATAAASFSLTVSSAVTATQTVASTTLTQNHAVTSFVPVTGGSGTGTLSYGVSPTLPSGLSYSSSTGAITGTPTAVSATTSYTVTVTDHNNATATATFSLAVDVAVVATQAVASTALTQNHASTSFAPVTGSGGDGTLTYSVSPTLPTGLSYATTTGVISGTASVASAATTYTVTITDINSATATATFSLTVDSGVVATQAIASKILTQNYAAISFTPVTGSGGTGTLSYSVSPALPAALSLNTATGAVSGTPTITTAASTYTVTVTDTNGATATASFSLTVDASVTATTVAASTTLTQNRVAIIFIPVTGAGGTGTLTYSVSPALPAGLSFNASTGAVSGTPTAAIAATSYTVTVTDANGATATASFSVTVNAAVTATTAVATTTLTQNRAATTFTPVTGGGGTTPLRYSISPALPAGLSFNASTGAVSGTPTATSVATTYTVTVSDTNNATATATFSLTVNAAVTATVAIASEALTYNAPASFTPITGTGGTGTLSYSISPALPAGLSLSSSTGAISGTTSVITAATTYTVIVTDTNNATASASFSLAVNKAASAVALTASASNITPVQQVMLTATVTDGTPGSTGTPSGQISFFDGSTLLTTVTASGGVAIYSTTLSPGATHAITAMYAGDGNFQAGATLAAVSVTVAPLDFTAAPISLPQPLYVVPGHSVSFTFNVAPQYGSFPGAVNFTLSGLPNGATYSFSPASLPASSTGGVITGTITVPTTVAANHTDGRKYAPMIAALLLLPFLGMKRSRKKMGMLVLLLLAGGALSTMTGCGSPGDGLLQQKSESIQVTLTITSGTISHSVPFTLIVE